ncbi:MAG TPA: TRAP transporter small permease [Syntrophorhabdales bacterium]|nr:TRAP transporter small permease [Syntrophorhabdales bacterium]
MKRVLEVIKGISRALHFFAGVALVFIVVLTSADVVLRAFKRPILGTYEIVAFTGAVVILFALPLSSWIRSHIYVDFFILKFSRRVQNVFQVSTRCMGLFLFFLFGWNVLKYAADLQRTGEVSVTLKLPFYPIIYAMGVCCFVQCLVLLCDLIKIVRGEYGE